MKKLILLSSLLTLCSTVNAQSVDQLKEAAIKACDMQISQLPEAQKATAQKICDCTLENTDYDALLADSQAGNIQKVMADSQVIAQKCTQEHQ